MSNLLTLFNTMGFFEKFIPKAKVEEKQPEKQEAPKRKQGLYRESELKDPDELKRLKEKLMQSGKYDMVDNFKDGVTWARDKKTKKVALINESGEETSGRFDNIGKFFDGVAKVDRKDKKGFFKYSFINRNGKLIAENWFDGAYSFSEGLAAVKKDGRWFFVNKDLEKIIGDFENVGLGFGKRDFPNISKKIKGACWVKKDGKWFLIDKEGNELPIYETSEKHKQDLIAALYDLKNLIKNTNEMKIVFSEIYKVILSLKDNINMMRSGAKGEQFISQEFWDELYAYAITLAGHEQMKYQLIDRQDIDKANEMIDKMIVELEKHESSVAP